MVAILLPTLIFANFLSKCKKFKENVLPMLDILSPTSMELDAVTSTGKKTKLNLLTSHYFK